jgi:hypothetical protein
MKIKIQVTLEWGSSLKLAFGSLLWMEKSHPPIVSPLLLQLLLLCQLNGVKSLVRHTLPVSCALHVLVHGLLHVTDSDVELTHLLSEGSPTRWRAQPKRWRRRVLVGSTGSHCPLTTAYISPSRATRILLVHGLIQPGAYPGVTQACTR